MCPFRKKQLTATTTIGAPYEYSYVHIHSFIHFTWNTVTAIGNLYSVLNWKENGMFWPDWCPTLPVLKEKRRNATQHNTYIHLNVREFFKWIKCRICQNSENRVNHPDVYFHSIFLVIFDSIFRDGEIRKLKHVWWAWVFFLRWGNQFWLIENISLR